MAVMPPPSLTIPETLHPKHAALLRECHFETAGPLADVIRTDEYDGIRIIYAITNPQQTDIVYVGDTEEGRDVRGRLKDHLDTRSKAGHVEKTSLVFVHVMVTEYMFLDRFEEEVGTLPELNKRKVAKHWKRNAKRNGADEARAAKRAKTTKAEREGTTVTLLNPTTKSAKETGKKTAKKPKKKRAPRSRRVLLLC